MSSDPRSVVARFATWLEAYSPGYAELRTPVAVHDGAPLRLGQFWEHVGWAPGVGYGGLHEPQRPERHVTRRAAEKAFAKWLAQPDFARSRNLTEATKAALWARLAARPWVFFAEAMRPIRQIGDVTFVDEDAGEDPPMLKSNGHPPNETAPSAVARLMIVTLNWHSYARSGRNVSFEAPPGPGLLAPFVGLWELAPGVWGMANPQAPLAAAHAVSRVLFRTPAQYVDYLVACPPEQVEVPGSLTCMTLFTLEDLKALRPERLAAPAFRILPGSKDRTSAVGRFDGMPIIVHDHGPNTRAGFVYVCPEDEARFRAFMKKEKLKSYDTQRAHRSPFLQPDDNDRELARRLHAEALDKPAAAAGSARRQPRGKVLAASADELAAVRRDAASLRGRLLAGRPGLELRPLGEALRDDDPPLVRAFWEIIGWDDELRAVAGYPDRDSSERALRAALDDYKSWGSPLKRSKLPRRYRVVQVDDQGVGLALTDETGAAHDPVVLGASSDTGEVTQAEPSYLRHVSRGLAGFAFALLPGYDIDDAKALAGVGETLLPRLAPDVRRLGATTAVYLVPAWPLPGMRVAAATFEDLVDWLAGPEAPLAPPLSLEDLRGDRIAVPAFRPTPALRAVSLAPRSDAIDAADAWYAGRIAGVPLIVGGGSLLCAPADADSAARIVADQGWAGAVGTGPAGR